MADVGSLMLVHFIEQQLEGWSFERPHWPLHVTLVPWFKVEDEEAVIRSLQRIAEVTDPLHLGVGPQEMFGVKLDVPVNVISNQGPIKELHEELLATLSNADTSFDDQAFTGSRYVAHITRHPLDGRHSNEGEDILVNEFNMVRLIDEKTCRVEHQFDLRRTR